MGKIFGRTLSLLVTFAMVFSVLLVMPVSTYAAYSFLWTLKQKIALLATVPLLPPMYTELQYPDIPATDSYGGQLGNDNIGSHHS